MIQTTVEVLAGNRIKSHARNFRETNTRGKQMWQKIESNKTGRALDKKECKERSDEFVTKFIGNC